MKKYFFLSILFLCLCVQSYTQVKQVTLQASGLTCSMCSKAIYKSIVALNFVKEVSSDIKTSSFTITFKDKQNVSFDEIKKAVTNAGFSVASFKAIVQFSKTTIQNDAHIVVDGKTLHFLDVKEQVLEGEKQVTLLDKNFVSTKDYKKYSKFTKMKCYETGVMENCCSKNVAAKSNRIYHVTL